MNDSEMAARDQAFRVQALGLAFELHRLRDDPAIIVTSAKTFLAFLTGEAPAVEAS